MGFYSLNGSNVSSARHGDVALQYPGFALTLWEAETQLRKHPHSSNNSWTVGFTPTPSQACIATHIPPRSPFSFTQPDPPAATTDGAPCASPAGLLSLLFAVVRPCLLWMKKYTPQRGSDLPKCSMTYPKPRAPSTTPVSFPTSAQA